MGTELWEKEKNENEGSNEGRKGIGRCKEG
jgi:hypothetical protein